MAKKMYGNNNAGANDGKNFQLRKALDGLSYKESLPTPTLYGAGFQDKGKNLANKSGY